MPLATLADVWPAVSQVHDGPQVLLDEIRRLYATLKKALPEDQPAIEAQILALSERYKATAPDADVDP